MTSLPTTSGRPSQKRRVRVIPTLLIDRDGRLVKSVRFGKRTYIGDPINAVRIFNTKRVDELLLMDIDAGAQGHEPDWGLIGDIAAEALMPVGYGGGLTSVDRIARAVDCGIEKVVLSSALFDGMALVTLAWQFSTPLPESITCNREKCHMLCGFVRHLSHDIFILSFS